MARDTNQPPLGLEAARRQAERLAQKARREADALRVNLQRRKAQSRARTEPEVDAPPIDPQKEDRSH